MMADIGSSEWIINQIKEFEKEYENQSDSERRMFIDGKITILKLWLNKKIENRKVLEIEFTNQEWVKKKIKECEGKHVQQVAYSSYHDALTQVCFGCNKVRTSLKECDVKRNKGVVE